jgi:hypothetical protein
MPVAMTKAKEAGGSCATDILEIEDNLDAIAKQDSLSAHSIRALAVLALIWINKLGMRLGGRRVEATKFAPCRVRARHLRSLPSTMQSTPVRLKVSNKRRIAVGLTRPDLGIMIETHSTRPSGSRSTAGGSHTRCELAHPCAGQQNEEVDAKRHIAKKYKGGCL